MDVNRVLFSLRSDRMYFPEQTKLQVCGSPCRLRENSGNFMQSVAKSHYVFLILHVVISTISLLFVISHKMAYWLPL